MFRRRHDDDAHYFFVHLQKTAGTSVFFQMHQSMGRPAVYPDRTSGDYDDITDPAEPVVSVDHLQRRWAVRRDQIRVVTGHFPMCTTELLDAEFRTFTILREPVARTLSYLRHHREVTPGDADLPLEAVYDDDFRFHGLIHNHMVKMFSLTVEEMTDGVVTRVEATPERLERAKQNLARIDVVGLQEDYAGFVRELDRRFGWSLSTPQHLNRSAPAPADDALCERILADNAQDMELYEFARSLVRERRSAASTA